METSLQSIGNHINNIYDNPIMGSLNKKVLIATLYRPEPVLLATTRLGPDRLILLTDKDQDKEQKEAIKLIQDSLGKVIEVKEVKTECYDIVAIATKCVEIIDMQPHDDLIFVNITGGRKTKAIALMFAAYARHERVTKIAYNPEEDKNAIVWLPRLSFRLTDSQKLILEKIDSGTFETIKDLSEKVDLSTAMLYRAIDELKDMDLISTEDGLMLTDAGKIAKL
ncbi:CRISPR locus-related DNA-binding protein [Candidatus Micrarchaeota archaeon]|nr:CRISPR locus-related DNA-binding protein [Candidatus Micrarchaeota archaeon]MBU1165739.1 CRISPR locus-related DNA-binding protein [Candidatus Micrarchaeota archaeon]MBU1887492.1 CRISPR locus-related DNA-binding protein [Candidatus Micrarchaeota archaeon]